MFPRPPITEQNDSLQIYLHFYIVKIKLVFVICYWSEKVTVISIGLSPEPRVTLSTFVTLILQIKHNMVHSLTRLQRW